MPAAIRPRCTALVEAGLNSTEEVAAALCDRRSAFSAVDWDDARLRALAQVPLHRVFVYGSLLTGLHNAGRLAGARLLGAATTSDSNTRRSAGAYSYAVDGADAPGLATMPLAGELYVCSTDQLDRLDALEDHPSPIMCCGWCGSGATTPQPGCMCYATPARSPTSGLHERLRRRGGRLAHVLERSPPDGGWVLG